MNRSRKLQPLMPCLIEGTNLLIETGSGHAKQGFDCDLFLFLLGGHLAPIGVLRIELRTHASKARVLPLYHTPWLHTTCDVPSLEARDAGVRCNCTADSNGSEGCKTVGTYGTASAATYTHRRVVPGLTSLHTWQYPILATDQAVNGRLPSFSVQRHSYSLMRASHATLALLTVRVVGLEPTTSFSPEKRATRLRHTLSSGWHSRLAWFGQASGTTPVLLVL